MLLNVHIFKILLSFCVGILVISIFPVPWVILFTLWSTSIITLLVFIHFGRQQFQFRKSIGINLMIMFFFSGAFSYQYSLPSSQRKHYSHIFLKGDHVYAEVLEADQDTVGYRKLILRVDAIFKTRKVHHSVGKLLCYANASQDVRKGDVLKISPDIGEIKNYNNPGEFDAEGYWRTKGIEHICFLNEGNMKIVSSSEFSDRFWLTIRDEFKQILGRFLSAENKQIAQALVLGDKSELSSAQRDQYANAGAMHVLAVSGMHVGILLAFLQWFFYRIKWFRKRGYFIVVALLVLWAFAFLTGLSSSVVRATLMFSVLSIGQLRGYSFFSLNALFVAGLIILFIDPRSLFSIGFQLSFLAMLGIAYFFGPLRNLLNSKYKIVNYFWDGTALGLAAQIGTVPISLYYFNQFPNYFLLTNLGLIILAGAAMISVILLLIFSWVPAISSAIGYIVDVIFTILNGFIDWINALPSTISRGFEPPVIWVLVTYICITSVIYFWNRKHIFAFRLSLTGLFLCGLVLIYNKTSNYFERELVVLNTTSKVVLIKEPGVVLCIYEKEGESLDRLEFMANSYAKRKGVDVIYKSLGVHESIKVASHIDVNAYRKEWRLHYFQDKISYPNKSIERRSEPLLLPPENAMKVVNTSKGAVIIKPNDKRF